MTPARISQKRHALGVTEAPLTRAGLATVAAFFASELGIRLENQTEWQQWRGDVRGIDFHQPITVEALPAGTRLSWHEKQLLPHEQPGGRLKPFSDYTKLGTSQFRTGTSFPVSTFKLFEFLAPNRALVSRASGMNSLGPGIVQAGGGVQYIIATIAPTLVIHTQAKTGARLR